MPDTFTQAYIECALWASTDGDGEPLDMHDPSPQLLADMEADCADFQTAHAELLAHAYAHDDVAYDEERAGHDFWLTRNRHGAGFWDRGLGTIGAALTDAAHAYGESYLYVGDDELIYN